MQISCAVSNVPIINCNLEKTDSKGSVTDKVINATC